jgi:hypothetical protein
MKKLSSIEIPLELPIGGQLDICQFNPVPYYGKRCKYEPEINGVGDGLTDFGQTLLNAYDLVQQDRKEEALNLYFPTGLAKGQRFFTGEDQIKALENRILADPDLLWSLCIQRNQKTLHWIYDVFKVGSIHAIRRVFKISPPYGHRHALCAIRMNSGFWQWGTQSLDSRRDIGSYSLSLVDPQQFKLAS